MTFIKPQVFFLSFSILQKIMFFFLCFFFLFCYSPAWICVIQKSMRFNP